MKNTQFEVENVFGDVIGKDSNSIEQIAKWKLFLQKECENKKTKILTFWNIENRKLKTMKQVLHLNLIFSF